MLTHRSFISAVGYALDSSISYESIASCANKHADITNVRILSKFQGKIETKNP